VPEGKRRSGEGGGRQRRRRRIYLYSMMWEGEWGV